MANQRSQRQTGATKVADDSLEGYDRDLLVRMFETMELMRATEDSLVTMS